MRIGKGKGKSIREKTEEEREHTSGEGQGVRGRGQATRSVGGRGGEWVQVGPRMVVIVASNRESWARLYRLGHGGEPSQKGMEVRRADNCCIAPSSRLRGSRELMRSQ